MDPWILEHVHNAFKKTLKELDFDIDQFSVKVHFFFKLSFVRRIDFAAMKEVTNLLAKYAVKHSATRLVAMNKAAFRLIERGANLEEYFLKFLAKQLNFKREIKETKRYESVTHSYLSFVTFVL